MVKKILSAGIDIGTTTTQVIFSNIIIENSGSLFSIPDAKITNKDVIYKSKIHFTPLQSPTKIDVTSLKKMIMQEYENAGINPSDISTGAVIITGETARKENSEEVLQKCSNFLGDFVVATAGPDLEGILAGYGSGAGALSKKLTGNTINFDIGGGTTNSAVFKNGDVIDSFALDIGGRILRVDENNIITYISDRIKPIIKELKLNLLEKRILKYDEAKLLCAKLSDILKCTISKSKNNDIRNSLFIGHENKEQKIDAVMFSGGVAEYIYDDSVIDSIDKTTVHGDIGPLLGYCIRNTFRNLQTVKIVEPKEKIRATVIGAGNYSLDISGSTIIYSDDILPHKNIPVVKVFEGEREDINLLSERIISKRQMYSEDIVAIAFSGPKSPTYKEIKTMSSQIIESFKEKKEPIIIIVKNDFAKALGQTIKNNINNSTDIICLDKINVNNGNYIDIGKSISGVVPVVVKTLLFG